MYSQLTELPELSATLTAHRDESGGLLLATLTAAQEPGIKREGVKVAIVIDRSGSMSGRKLFAATSAVAQLVRSLSPSDRISIVTYDDRVQLVSAMGRPTEDLARRVEAIQSGGSTNLYEGWLTGAKLVGPSGRVVLLSDGLANVGTYTDAYSLAREASTSYVRYKVTTTTIGVGEDYDEALMGGMAKAGGGAHYFAHTAEALGQVFSRERHSFASVALSHVSLRFGGTTVQVGHLWAGETKRVVLRVHDLAGAPASVRYTQLSTSETHTLNLEMPRQFGHSDEATLELILVDASDAESLSSTVRDPGSAKEARQTVRGVLLRLLAHPLADTEVAISVRSMLEASLSRLEGLEVRYDERVATVHRKRSVQTSRNVAERAKAYSSYEEDALVMDSLSFSAMATVDRMHLAPCPEALALVPRDQWRSWRAVPVDMDENTVQVVIADARDGFLLAEIEKACRRNVRAVPVSVLEAQILEALER